MRKAREIFNYVSSRNAKFIEDEEDGLQIQMDGKFLSLDPGKPGQPNVGLYSLFSKFGMAGTATQIGRATLAAFQTLAYAHAGDGKTRVRPFSAISEDSKRIYLPQSDGALCISCDKISLEQNTLNQDGFRIEPAKDQQVFTYTPGDPREGLQDFERAVIEPMALRVPEMGYLLAMQLVFFPFLRSEHQDRFICLLKGPSGHGKSTAARFISRLHGWQELRGDYSVSAVSSLGDCGLVLLDNKEQKNLEPKMVDWLLFASTGGERGRANRGGGLRDSSSGRPIVAMTSIEGVSQVEAVNRCLEFEFRLSDEERPEFSERLVTRRLLANRDKIWSALAHVLQKYLEYSHGGLTSYSPPPPPKAVERFGDNWRTICELLYAYGKVAGKNEDWVDHIVGIWVSELSEKDVRNEGLSYPIRKYVDHMINTARHAKDDEIYSGFKSPEGKLTQEMIWAPVSYQGEAGKLYVTQVGAIQSWARSRDLPIPKDTVLGARLSEVDSPDLRVLRAEDVKGESDEKLWELLKRRSDFRPVGFFVPDGVKQ
jgi:hypothetical protein